MTRTLPALAGVALSVLASPALAAEAPLRPDQQSFRELYRELVDRHGMTSRLAGIEAVDVSPLDGLASPARAREGKPDGRRDVR